MPQASLVSPGAQSRRFGALHCAHGRSPPRLFDSLLRRERACSVPFHDVPTVGTMSLGLFLGMHRKRAVATRAQYSQLRLAVARPAQLLLASDAEWANAIR